MTRPIVDIHTHNLQAEAPSVISVEPGYDFQPGRRYSVGIHPWHAEQADHDTLGLLDRDATHNQVVAIGETGIDKLRGGPVDRQIELLCHHIGLSESLGLPLVLHIVRAYPEIINLKRSAKPTQPWIIHGFRGNPQLAAELLRQGFHLSLGERFHPDTPAVIPPDRLHFETDDSTLPISAIASRITSACDRK